MTEATGLEIAVIGMAARFPGAANVEQFWNNLRDGVESIAFFPPAPRAGWMGAVTRHPQYVPAAGVLEDIESFDAAFFGIPPREAELIDPQHRVFLECAWEALEGAGYDPESYQGAIGVYAGAGFGSYLLDNLRERLESVDSTALGYQILFGNNKDHLTTRAAYRLGLTGPSVTVQTACSTSLVAVHLACRALLGGECDMALAGGVTIRVPHDVGHVFEQGGVLSPDGHCRAFDAEAQGTVFGSGAGVVLLKRLEEARADRDEIHAVIKGSAINNDGANKMAYPAPSLDAQARVVRAALQIAGADPNSITYVEAHGTGTALGDPIEIAALAQAFGGDSARKGYCALGSVKTNVGHLDAAAGVAGLIKAVLALKHQMLPPSLHYRKPNPRIDFAASPFFVNTTLRPWNTEKGPRRAGVSAFGIGGTNAHVIVEEAPERAASGASRPLQLLCVSARTQEALQRRIADLRKYLERRGDTVSLADVAFTLHMGRKPFPYRHAISCSDVSEALQSLGTGSPEQAVPGRPVVFLFRDGPKTFDLSPYESERRFREAAEAIVAPGARAALFRAYYAAARLWMYWGVRPKAMLGAGIGAQVAACLDGRLSIAQALASLEEPGITMPAAIDQEPDALVLDIGARNPIHELGRLWAAGVQVDWNAFYEDQQRCRVTLPTYPYERRRHWIDSRAAAHTEAVEEDLGPDHWFYARLWKQTLPCAAPRRDASRWLVSGGGRITTEVGVELKRRGTDVAFGEPRELPGRGGNVMWAGSDVFDLLELARGIASWENGRIYVLSENGCQITTEEAVSPEQAMLSAACQVISQEYPGVKCRQIDFNAAAYGRAGQKRLMELLARELESGSTEPMVAYRGESRWVPHYERVPLAKATLPERLRQRGVYAITGGLGGVGLRVAEFLARTVAARLVLISRSRFPAREVWEGRPDVARKTGALLRIEKAGSPILLLQADVTSEPEMREAFSAIRHEFGELHGVIHAAGARMRLPIEQMTREDFARQLRPRAEGLRVLEKLLAEESVDFCCFMSSLAAVLGGAGLAAYSAAHAFGDAFVARHNTSDPGSWFAVNWDHWLDAEELHAARKLSPSEPILSPEDGEEVLARIFSGMPAAQIAISRRDLNARIRDGQKPIDAGRQPGIRPPLSMPYEAPRNEIENQIAAIWRDALGLDQVGIHDNFYELGGDSVVAIQIAAKMNASGFRLSPAQAMENPTVAGLAALASTACATVADQSAVTGPAPLTPIQRRYFEITPESELRSGMRLVFEAAEPIEVSRLIQAVEHVLEHHDALRLRFVPDGRNWQQYCESPGGSTPVLVREAGDIDQVTAEMEHSLELSKQPLIRVVLMREAGRSDRILFLVHHLVADAISCRILLEDLESAYRYTATGKVRLPAKTTSFVEWARRLHEYARSEEIRRDLPHWLSLKDADRAALPRGGNLTTRFSAALSAEDTERLMRGLAGATFQDALLAALALALRKHTGQGSMLVNLEGHGRESLFPDIDVSRTVGWFTTLYPVLIDLEACDDRGKLLTAIHQQVRNTPAAGISYGLLRYLSDEEAVEQLRELPEAEVNVLYLGPLDHLLPARSLLKAPAFMPARRSGGRAHTLDLVSFTRAGRFEVNGVCSSGIDRTFCDGIMEALSWIASGAGQADEFGWSARDRDAIAAAIREAVQGG